MSRTITKLALAAGTALGIGALTAAVALAHPVKVVGGETELKLHKNTAAALASLGIEASGTTYPVTGGTYSFHPLNDEGGGVIKHKRALVLESLNAKVKLKRFAIDLPVQGGHHEAKHAHGVLSAKVRGTRINVAHLNTKRYQVPHDEPGFSDLKLELTKKAAKALNGSFGTDAFAEGLKLGKLANQSKVEEIEEH